MTCRIVLKEEPELWATDELLKRFQKHLINVDLLKRKRAKKKTSQVENYPIMSPVV